MPPRLLRAELHLFARKHGLPQPVLTEDLDGRHAFLYSHDTARRYAYSLTWAEEQPHVLWVMLNPGTGETEGRRRNTLSVASNGLNLWAMVACFSETFSHCGHSRPENY